jgi:glucose/arabinose dehydrogenase
MIKSLSIIAGLVLVACDAPAQIEASSEDRGSANAVAQAGGPVAAPAGVSASAQASTPAAVPAAAQAAEPAKVMAGPLPALRIPNPPFVSNEVARFDEPWAMTFLPDGRLLVSEKRGRLQLFNIGNAQKREISGVPAVAYGGQGGFGDVVLHPHYPSNGLVYLSYAEAGSNNTRGAAVARARLVLDAGGNGGRLEDLQVIWRQMPKVTGEGHYGHRIAFGGDGKLWITSSDRQKLTPAQDMQSALGKLIRLNDDGSLPADNPFASQGGVAAQVWTLGHRNLLGIAFDPQGQLWTHEMGPAGGDEINRIERGSNYGWPVVSEGRHYDGASIPGHATRPEFNAPEAFWNPVISPAGLVIYTGQMFPYFHGNAFIGGLSSQALIRVELNGTQAREAARYPMGRRIREVEQGPDGALWLLEDGANARLLKLTPNPG